MGRTAAVLILLAGAQADRIGRDRAPAAALKALAEVQKKKAVAIVETTQLGLAGETTSTFEGVLKKDVAAVKGSAEVYARGRNYVLRVGDRYDQGARLRGEEAVLAASFRNPAVMLAEAARLVPGAVYLEDEEVDGRACKVISLPADGRLLKEHLAEVADLVQKQLTGLAKDLFSGNLTSYLDEKLSTSRFVLWVGKADLLVHQMEWSLEAESRQASLPPGLAPFRVTRRCVVKFSRWDEELALDIPAPVKARLGIP